MRSLDHRIVAWMSGLDLPLVTPLAKALSAVGASGLVFVDRCRAVGSQPAVAPVVVTLVTVIIAETLSRIMKAGSDRPRPSVAHADVHALVAVPSNARCQRPRLDRVRVRGRPGSLEPRLRPVGSSGLLIALSASTWASTTPATCWCAACGAATGGAVLLALRLGHVQPRADNDGDRGQ
jgi:hypothetical protein